MNPDVELHDDLSGLEEEWSLLSDAGGNPFLTWEWASLWWRHYGNGRPLVIGVARQCDGRARCIVPLFLAARRPLRVLRFVGHTTSDVLAPVCARGDEVFAAAAVRRLLALRSGWDVFLGDRLAADDAWVPALQARLLSSEPCPVLENPGDWSTYLRSRTRNLRQHVGAKARRLEAQHEVVYRLSGPQELDDDLDALFRLHEARWGSQSSFTRMRGFHEEFARRALARGWLRLWVLEVDGRPAAALYGLRYGGDEWFYQSGRDPSLEAESVGSVLFTHTIAAALDDGVGHYRLLRGGEGYKLRFATGSPALHTCATGRGLTGRAAVAVAGSAGHRAVRTAADLVGLR